jgi:hypothetical protein
LSFERRTTPNTLKSFLYLKKSENAIQILKAPQRVFCLKKTILEISALLEFSFFFLLSFSRGEQKSIDGKPEENYDKENRGI